MVTTYELVKHFIIERFKPYIESGAYKKPRR